MSDQVGAGGGVDRDRLATIIQNAIAEHCSVDALEMEIDGTGPASFKAADHILTAMARQAGAGGGVVDVQEARKQALLALYRFVDIAAREKTQYIRSAEFETADQAAVDAINNLAALAPSPSAGEPDGFRVDVPNFGPCFFLTRAEADEQCGEPGSEGATVRPLYATPTPTLVQSTASVEGVRHAVADAINRARYRSPTPGLPERGVDEEDPSSREYAFRLADAAIASLTPAPTPAEDGGLVATPAIRTCGPIAPMVEPFDDKWLGDGDSVHVLPTPSSPVSAPSPVGGVRGHVTRMSDSSHYDEVCTMCGATDAMHGGTLHLPCPGAPSSPARPEPVSAPAGELVELSNWLREFAKTQSSSIDRGLLNSAASALSNPAPGHGEAVDKDAYDNMVAWMSMNAPYRHMMTFKSVLASHPAPAEKPAPAHEEKGSGDV